jgi:threonine/homoserine/homoserine lactone efflux protein
VPAGLRGRRGAAAARDGVRSNRPRTVWHPPAPTAPQQRRERHGPKGTQRGGIGFERLPTAWDPARCARLLTGPPAAANLSSMSVEFLLTSLVVAAIPGTGVVYTVSSSIGGGWRRGLFAAIGCTLGIVPHILAAMLGLSAIMQAGAVVFEVVRYAGVAYLVFMGVSMIRNAGALPLDDENSSIGPVGLVVRRGILLNILNPKLTVFFFAFLPQFLDASPGLLDARLVGLGGVFMLVTLAVFAVYAYASAAVRDLVLAAPIVRRWIERALGTLLIGFAAKLAVTDR